jgi:hypothetical protein
MAGRANCQNGRNRAVSAKMAGTSKSCAKRSANMAKKFGTVFAYANRVPQINIFLV